MIVGRFKQPLWVVPLVIAALVAIFGLWGNAQLRRSIQQQVRAQLRTTLDANATALEIWMVNQKKIASELADDQRLRLLALRLLEENQAVREGTATPERTNLSQFNGYLRPRLIMAGYTNAQLVDTNLDIIVPRRFGPGLGVPRVAESQTNKFQELFDTGLPVVITPYKPELGGLRGNRGPRGGQRPGGPNEQGRGARAARADAARARRGDLTLMQVAAPIKNNDGDVVGALTLIVNPDEEFTKILSVARTGKTGETYAFDQTGLLISESRFDVELKTKGLLEITNKSALNLRLHDPDAAEVEGTKPLTQMVAAAVAEEDGINVEPSRDYRGVEVVGAWKWLPDYQIGVATQVDADEAYEPLRVLKLLFMMLCLLLLLCAAGMFLFSYANFRWRKQLTEAELKLKQLGQYTLEEKIGEGGMGVVYRARHALLRRDTAVKLLTPDRADPVSVERFEREVRLTCQLTHPNTIQVFDYGHTPDGVFYYAMEFLNGLNLHELVARYGPQTEGRTAYILGQVCDSLSEAHSVGLVHRDIKPANVFLCKRGGVPDWVKVLDFGLVREYDAGGQGGILMSGGRGLEGTPWFMPPEAIKDPRASDPRSDIYAVGALGYYLLTGRFVFDSQNIAELCEKQLNEIPVEPSKYATNPISAKMDAAILKCLEKDPDLRPQTAVDLRDLLMACPRAAEWTPEARAAWWERYQNEAAAKLGGSNDGDQTPMDVTVKVDLESRLHEPTGEV
jgi:eukaryotic-like serine/threonine-protein kinase